MSFGPCGRKGIMVDSVMKKKGTEAPALELVHPATTGIDQKLPQVIGIPLLKGVVGTHGADGDHRSLRTMPVAEMIGVPASWCPNPAYTSLLRVKGHSMEPLVRNGDIVSVDSFQTDQEDLFDKVIIAANDQKGLCVSRLRRYDRLAILEAENREYHSIVLNKA